MRHPSQETLADKIASVLSTAPTNLDIDEESDDDTRAKVIIENDFKEHVDQPSAFRKQNVDLLADVDVRYAGKKGSRRDLSSPISAHSDEYDSDSRLGESDGGEENSILGQSDGDSAELPDSDSEVEDSEGNDNDITESPHATDFKHMNDDNVSFQQKKGSCVRNQMSIWENVLEMRIQMQKCLLAANKLPSGYKREEIKRESANEFADKVGETRDSLTSLLGKLLQLQNLCWSRYHETKNLRKSKYTLEETEDPDDEEIPSDTDEENDVEEDNPDEDEVPTKKMKLGEFECQLKNQHEIYKKYRTSVIQKWHDKTNISVMKNNVSSYSVINTIEHALADKTKLVKKSQLKKSDYEILGEENSENLLNPTENSSSGEHYPEIYDDTDFYHQLLRELIEVKSADITDPIHLGRQWIQIQSVRSKMKRKIDTSATKGRKMRFAVHSKLVNFTARNDDCLLTNESCNELMSSIFGKKSLGGE